jgi:D-amino peptidase
MRAYILCDYEGTTGVVSWDDEENSLGPEAMAGDVNATIEGLRQGGFTEFVVRDYHAGGRNMRPADVDPEASLIRGKSTPYPYGLSADFDAMCFVGAHCMAGVADGVMCHTMNGDIYDLRLNGKLIGEVGGFAYLAGHFDVPLILVAGDKAVCEEAKGIIGDVETAVTKIGLSRNCAEVFHPKVSRKNITEGALRAAKRLKEFKPLKAELPCTLDITYRNADYTDRLFEVTGGERISDRTVRLVADSTLHAFNRFEHGFK